MQPEITRTLVGTVQEIAFDVDGRVYLAVMAMNGLERVYADMMALHASWLIFIHRAENLIEREVRLDFSGTLLESFEILQSDLTAPQQVLAYAS